MTLTSRPSLEPPSSLTSEPDRFSDDAWELLLSGQDVARRWRHQDLDVESNLHLKTTVAEGESTSVANILTLVLRMIGALLDGTADWPCVLRSLRALVHRLAHFHVTWG